MRSFVLTAVAVTAMLFLAAPVGATDTGITPHDRQVIRFFQHHPRLARTPAGAAALAKVLPRVIRSLQAADVAAANPYPPHHRLWVCISRGESTNWQEHHGTYPYGRGGGLQMSDNWLGLLKGRASDLSQAQQEWLAERAWAASGFSYSFLYGQWYEWDEADGCGTTG